MEKEEEELSERKGDKRQRQNRREKRIKLSFKEEIEREEKQ